MPVMYDQLSIRQRLKRSCQPMLDSRGGQTAAREPHAALWAFRKIIICFLFFISIANCRNIVKWCCSS